MVLEKASCRICKTPAAAFQNAAAGMVNGMQTLMAGIGGDLVIEIPVDGEAFYRATIRDFRRVNRANPEVVSGV